MPRVPINEVVANAAGDVQGAASAFAYLPTTTTPVTVYAAETGTATLAQPLSAGADGVVPGWVDVAPIDLVVGATRKRIHGTVEAVPTAFTGAAIEAAIAALGTDGGTVVLRAGTYSITSPITVPSNVRLVGAGKGATYLIPSTAITALRFNGANNASRCRRSGMADLTVRGNGQTITSLVEAIYADRLEFDRCEFNSVNGRAFYGVDVWDSRWNDCRSNNAGAAGVPAFLFRSADTGITPADTANNLTFNDFTCETFIGGALWVERNGGNQPSVIRITGGKMESTVATGPFLRWERVVYSSIHGLRMHQSGGSNGLDLATLQGYYLDVRGLVMTSSGAVVPRTGLQINGLNGGGWSTYSGIDFEWISAPSVACVEYVNAPANLEVGRVSSGVGTLFSGAATFAAGSPLRQVAGPVSDASFYEAPPNGTQAVDTTNNRLYVRVGGTWRFAALT